MIRKTLAIILILCTCKLGAAQILGGGTQFSNTVLFNQSWLAGCPSSATSLSNQAALEPVITIDSCAPLPVCVKGTAVSDIWFSFFAQSTTVKIVINPGASFNVAIQAFSGSTCPGLTDIGCIDDGGNGITETLNLAGLTLNQLYYFRVLGSSTDISDRRGTGIYNFCGSEQLGSTVLAVEINSFNATKINNVVQLSWITASASGSSYFEIERSSNGSIYQTIGRVAGAGTTSQTGHYSFTDVTPLPTGVSYYRLKEASNNGGYKYSNVVMIKAGNKLQKAVVILSNPVTGKLNVRISSDVAANLQLKVINNRGQVICRQNGVVVKGDNIIAVTSSGIHDLAEGIYTLQAVINNEILNTKFISVK